MDSTSGWLGLLGEFREVNLGAIRTHTVGELRLRPVLDVGLHLIPVAMIVTDLLAAAADGKQATESLYLVQGLAQLLHALSPFPVPSPQHQGPQEGRE